MIIEPVFALEKIERETSLDRCHPAGVVQVLEDFAFDIVSPITEVRLEGGIEKSLAAEMPYRGKEEIILAEDIRPKSLLEPAGEIGGPQLQVMVEQIEVGVADFGALEQVLA